MHARDSRCATSSPTWPPPATSTSCAPTGRPSPTSMPTSATAPATRSSRSLAPRSDPTCPYTSTSTRQAPTGCGASSGSAAARSSPPPSPSKPPRIDNHLRRPPGFVAGLRAGGRELGHVRLEPERRELRPRRDAQLREHVAQVEVDGAGAEEELRADLAVCQALGDELRDLVLLRGQLGRGRLLAPRTRGLATRAKLASRAARPRHRIERVEGLQCRAEVLAGVDAAPLPAQRRAVREFGARALERAVPVRMLGECLSEHRIGFLGHVREQGAAVGDAAACPWRFGRRREGAQLV